MDAKYKKQFNQIVQDILEDFRKEKYIPKALQETYEKQIRHVMPDHSHAFSAFYVPMAYKYIKPTATEEELNLAGILGWAIQILQAYTVMIDDFVDKGENRHDLTTWTSLHQHDPSLVLFDSLMLESSSYFLLKKYFAACGSRYLQLLELWQETIKQTWRGYRWESYWCFTNVKNGIIPEEDLSWENFRITGQYKWRVWPHLTLTSALILTGIDKNDPSNQKLFDNVLQICNGLASFLTLKTSMTDSFRKDKHTKTLDLDIRRGHLSWLFLTAKQKCKSDKHREILLTNYGVDNHDNVRKVRNLYEELKLTELFARDVKLEYQRVQGDVKNLFGDSREGKLLQKWLNTIMENDDW